MTRPNHSTSRLTRSILRLTLNVVMRLCQDFLVVRIKSLSTYHHALLQKTKKRVKQKNGSYQNFFIQNREYHYAI